MSKLLHKGEFKGKNYEVLTNIFILLFKEGDAHIAYAPAFDLSGYGTSEEEARESFNIVLEEFIDYTAKKKTLKSELKRLGWKTQRSDHHMMKAPPFDDLISSNADIKQQMEGPGVHTITKQVQLPSFA